MIKNKTEARHVQAAMKHFGIETKEVTDKHVRFIQDQERAENARYENEVLGREYTVTESGNVEFTKPHISHEAQELMALVY